MLPDLVLFDCDGVLVDTAVAAGMRVLGYGAGMARPEALRVAGAEVFDRMSDVPALLGLPPTDR